MKDAVLIVSPLFPPNQGGLPAHTDRLAQALSVHRSVTVLTSAGVEANRPFRVEASVRDWHDSLGMLAAIESAVGAGPVLWQYVPHMYGRGGVNFALPRVLGALRRRGVRQVVVAHEIAAPFSWWPHRTAYAVAHRWMWRAICTNANAVGISTDTWLQRWRRKGAGADRFFLAPSPANLPVVTSTTEQLVAWRAKQGVGTAALVLGYFGTVGGGKLFEWVLAAWRAVRREEPRTGLAIIGARPVVDLAPGEAPWFRALGYLDDTEASRALQALDVLLVPFSDGVSERRGSFMAGISHGLPVVTTIGSATGAELSHSGCFVGSALVASSFVQAVSEVAADPARRRQLGDLARVQYRRRYDWPELAAQLHRRLGG